MSVDEWKEMLLFFAYMTALVIALGPLGVGVGVASYAAIKIYYHEIKPKL